MHNPLSVVPRQNVDICTALPDLSCFLTIPPPGDHILARSDVLRDLDLVGDHAQRPVPAAPALVPVVVRGNKLRWHVCCVSTVPSKLEKVVVSIFLNLPEYVPTNSAVICIAFVRLPHR